MKIIELFENVEKSLIGIEVNGRTNFANKKWSGSFNVSGRQLTTLEGAPSSITDIFRCDKNKLTSLVGAPTTINGDFTCDNNQLTSLEGAPNFVGGVFSCDNNQLTSLKNVSDMIVDGDFYCENNQLTSLEGAPNCIGGLFSCENNQLTSLKNIHKIIKEINHMAYFINNPIKSHVLGLLKIRNIRTVRLDNKELETIINKYLPLGDIIACQRELIEAGLEDFAQL